MGYAYNPLGAWTATHQMSINGKFDNITRADLLSLANANNIKNASEIHYQNPPSKDQMDGAHAGKFLANLQNEINRLA